MTVVLGIILVVAGLGLGVLAIIDKSDEAMSVVPFTTILIAVGILIALGVFVVE